MTEKNEPLRIHPKATERVDRHTKIFVSKSPRRGERDNFIKIASGHSTCGFCGSENTEHIHYTSGATTRLFLINFLQLY